MPGHDAVTSFAHVAAAGALQISSILLSVLFYVEVELLVPALVTLALLCTNLAVLCRGDVGVVKEYLILGAFASIGIAVSRAAGVLLPFLAAYLCASLLLAAVDFARKLQYVKYDSTTFGYFEWRVLSYASFRAFFRLCENGGLPRGVSDNGVLYISLIETSTMFLCTGDRFRSMHYSQYYNFSNRTEMLSYSALKTASVVLLPVLERFLVGTIC